MNTTKLLDIAKEAREKYGSVEGWGTYGLCWGGKVSNLMYLDIERFNSKGQLG